jgi:glycosyltransferase involved in cell wall biosynthesis
VGTLGGAERSLLDLIASLRTAAPHARVGLVAGGGGPLLEAAAALGVDVRLVELPASVALLGDSVLSTRDRFSASTLALRALRGTGALAPYLSRLARAIRSFEPSVIHTNGMKMHLLGAAVRPRSSPVVWHMRDLLSQRRVMAQLLRGAALRTNLVLAISNAVAVDTRRVLGRTPVHVVYNAIDVEQFAPEGTVADLDALAGIAPAPSGTLRVGLVATYAHWKGHEVFIDAAARMLRRHPGGVRFYVVGGEAYQAAGSQFSRSELAALASGLGLDRHMAFVPFQQRPEDVFRALDVVVHASTRPEPFGRTIVEAMSCGRAVVAANEGGASELVTSGVDALAVTPREPEALADACVRLLDDPALRRRLGVAGRATALARFSRRRLGHQVLAEYERLGVA